MSEENPKSPQPVFGISPDALAGIVAGNRAALGLPPQDGAATPGQAAYDAYLAHLQGADPGYGQWVKPFADIDKHDRDAWEAAAQAAIDVFLAGDSVSAESIREALAAQDARPASSAGPRDEALEVARGKLRRIAMGWERDPSAGADEALVMIRELLEQPQPAPELTS